MESDIRELCRKLKPIYGKRIDALVTHGAVTLFAYEDYGRFGVPGNRSVILRSGLGSRTVAIANVWSHENESYAFHRHPLLSYRPIRPCSAVTVVHPITLVITPRADAEGDRQDSLINPYEVMSREGQEGRPAASRPGIEETWIFVNTERDAFSNYGELALPWQLGNLERDDLSDILAAFEDEVPPPLRASLHMSDAELLRRFGDASGTRVYGPADYRARLVKNAHTAS